VKPVVFHPNALAEFRALPKTIRIAFGTALRILQEGVSLGMPASELHSRKCLKELLHDKP